jgi:hypothetical protein
MITSSSVGWPFTIFRLMLTVWTPGRDSSSSSTSRFVATILSKRASSIAMARLLS